MPEPLSRTLNVPEPSEEDKRLLEQDRRLYGVCFIEEGTGFRIDPEGVLMPESESVDG